MPTFLVGVYFTGNICVQVEAPTAEEAEQEAVRLSNPQSITVDDLEFTDVMVLEEWED